MPELPEIETVKRTLTPLLTGGKIVEVVRLRDDVIKHPKADLFAERLIGAKIHDLSRRGKYLRLHLDDGQTLVAHLRMTGRLLCAPPDHPCKPHTHVIIKLDNGQELRFSDTRRFGCLWLLGADEADAFTGQQNLGVEPLSTEFNADYLVAHLGQRRSAVKNAILDQHVIAGLGNIYADEVLFAASVRPERLCCDVTQDEWREIAAVVVPILQSAIAHNGTTFNDFLDGEGKEGENLPFLQAYGRYGQPCRRCGATMQRTRVGGRGTCFCAECQK